MKLENLSRRKKLVLSILLDVIGMITFIDLVWAPISAYIMTRMYNGNKGKIAGAVSFIEEIVPGLDFIPSFTIMWFLTYVFNKKDNQEPITI